MTWSYSSAVSSGKDQVRFLCQDTDTNDQLLQDEEIAWLLTENKSNVYETAANACDLIADRYARRGGRKRVGDLEISYKDATKDFRARATSLRARALRASSPIPYAGGQSVTDKDIDEDDTDMVQPTFSIGMFDNPDVGPIDTDIQRG